MSTGNGFTKPIQKSYKDKPHTPYGHIGLYANHMAIYHFSVPIIVPLRIPVIKKHTNRPTSYRVYILTQ